MSYPRREEMKAAWLSLLVLITEYRIVASPVERGCAHV
jgi:hypothetical protein